MTRHGVNFDNPKDTAATLDKRAAAIPARLAECMDGDAPDVEKLAKLIMTVAEDQQVLMLALAGLIRGISGANAPRVVGAHKLPKVTLVK